MSKHVKTANQMSFAQTVHADVPRSIFDRPFSHKTTFNCGMLVPLYVDEVLPGDTFDLRQSFISRLSTPIFPTMDDLIIELMAFYVPNRLVWDHWQELMGENTTGAWTPAQEPALVPVYEYAASGVTTTVSKKMGDYCGIPVGTDLSKYPISALPYRGIALIYNEWFRDENLQAPIPINKGDTITSADYAYGPNADLFTVDKFHDYFTSALPAPQKGDSPLIPIELNTLIPVITGNYHSNDGNALAFKFDNNLQAGYTYPLKVGNGVAGHIGYARIQETNGDINGTDGAVPINLWADARGIGHLNDTTISELRTAFQIQKLLEKDARGGTRYVEMLKAHFGVDAGDYRLQRPEFLGRFKTYVGMQSVPQTSSTDNTSPQGNLAAFSLTGGSSCLFNKSFVEHGFVYVFAIVRQVKTYQQGIEKFWFRRERFDYYFPTLAHISEQPILNKEIYSLGNDGDDIFGYQEAWAEYRYKPNRISGQMRSGVTNSLDTWHYADYYTQTPVLSDGWIKDNSSTNVNRTLAVSMSQDDQIRMDIKFDCVATRPMPVYSIPGLVDHF